MKVKEKKIIKFYKFNIKKGMTTFMCLGSEYEKPIEVYFKYHKRMKPSNDAVAYCIAALCGIEQYTKIELDLEISNNAKKNIKSFVKVNFKTPKCNDNVIDRSNYKNTLLNFSGGFDSMATLYLLPKKTKLVSIDFGGNFKRENEFFKKFKPYTVQTNIRNQGIRLDKNSWTFMSIAAILYADFLKAKYNVFGTILEASKMQTDANSSSFDKSYVPPFSFIGLNDLKITNGLTEVGTVMIMLSYGKKYISDSIASLAALKSEKRYRKQTLLDIAAKKKGITIDYEYTKAPEKKIEWGTNFTIDFLSLYIIKNAGLQKAKDTICNIPDEAEKLVKDLNLDFYERINTNFINGKTFPNDEMRAEVVSKLIKAGILPYNENDYVEFRKVIDFLLNYYPNK